MSIFYFFFKISFAYLKGRVTLRAFYLLVHSAHEQKGQAGPGCCQESGASRGLPRGRGGRALGPSGFSLLM